MELHQQTYGDIHQPALNNIQSLDEHCELGNLTIHVVGSIDQKVHGQDATGFSCIYDRDQNPTGFVCAIADGASNNPNSGDVSKKVIENILDQENCRILLEGNLNDDSVATVLRRIEESLPPEGSSTLQAMYLYPTTEGYGELISLMIVSEQDMGANTVVEEGQITEILPKRMIVKVFVNKNIGLGIDLVTIQRYTVKPPFMVLLSSDGLQLTPDRESLLKLLNEENPLIPSIFRSSQLKDDETSQVITVR